MLRLKYKELIPGISMPENKRTLRAMYVNQILGSFSSGLASPFIPYYAADLNFTPGEMGILQASSNLFPNVLQYPFGKLSDIIQKRIIFIIIGGIVSSLVFIFLIGQIDPLFIVLLIIVQAIFSAMVTPAWNALIGDVALTKKRASFIGSLSFYSNFSMLFAGLFFLIYTMVKGTKGVYVYYLPFGIAGVVGVLGTLVMLYAQEPEKKKVIKSKRSLMSIIKNDREFSYFLFAQGFYNFFMSISWPLIFITTVKILKASSFQIAVINLIGLSFTVPFLILFGRITDRYGPKIPMLLSRIMFIPVPLVYAFANSIYDIYLLNVLTGISTAFANISFLAYILDSSPTEDRGKYVGLYNTVIGFVTFFGSIFGGFLAQFLEGFYGLYMALLITYMVSFAGRFTGAVLFIKVKERRKYPQHMLLFEKYINGIRRFIKR